MFNFMLLMFSFWTNLSSFNFERGFCLLLGYFCKLFIFFSSKIDFYFYLRIPGTFDLFGFIEARGASLEFLFSVDTFLPEDWVFFSFESLGFVFFYLRIYVCFFVLIIAFGGRLKIVWATVSLFLFSIYSVLF